MNLYTMDTSVRHKCTHTHEHIHTQEMAALGSEDHSMLKVLVVLDISKVPPCLPLRRCNFLAESMPLIYLCAWFGDFVSLGPEFG